jgi:hypothetical protein
MVPTVCNSVCCSERFFMAEWGLWLSHSPGLKLCDFYLWGLLKISCVVMILVLSTI